MSEQPGHMMMVGEIFENIIELNIEEKDIKQAIGDGGITEDFWIIKVHYLDLDHPIPGIINFLWIFKVHTFI